MLSTCWAFKANNLIQASRHFYEVRTISVSMLQIKKKKIRRQEIKQLALSSTAGTARRQVGLKPAFRRLSTYCPGFAEEVGSPRDPGRDPPVTPSGPAPLPASAELFAKWQPPPARPRRASPSLTPTPPGAEIPRPLPLPGGLT